MLMGTLLTIVKTKIHTGERLSNQNLIGPKEYYGTVGHKFKVIQLQVTWGKYVQKS